MIDFGSGVQIDDSTVPARIVINVQYAMFIETALLFKASLELAIVELNKINNESE